MNRPRIPNHKISGLATDLDGVEAVLLQEAVPDLGVGDLHELRKVASEGRILFE